MLLGATAGAHSGEVVVLKPRIQLVFLHIASFHLKVNEFFELVSTGLRYLNILFYDIKYIIKCPAV